MDKLIKTLHEGNYSCVIENSGKTYTFNQRGVADLYDLVKNQRDILKNARVADKVVGKGAAALMILGGISQLYTDTISQPALALLHETGIQTDYEHVVPFIYNRDKTGWCPVEQMCHEETSVETIFSLIEKFLYSIKNNGIKGK